MQTSDSEPGRLTSRQRILLAANTLHSKKAAFAIKIREIATLADVSPALVISHFKSKDELLFEAYLHWMQTEETPTLEAWLSGETHPTARSFLAFNLDLCRATLHRSRDLLATSYWWTAPEMSRFQAAVAGKGETVLRLLRDEFPNVSEQDREDAERVLRLVFEDGIRQIGAQHLHRQATAHWFDRATNLLFRQLDA